jgi:hypothetical protein
VAGYTAGGIIVGPKMPPTLGAGEASRNEAGPHQIYFRQPLLLITWMEGEGRKG